MFLPAELSVAHVEFFQGRRVKVNLKLLIPSDGGRVVRLLLALANRRVKLFANVLFRDALFFVAFK